MRSNFSAITIFTVSIILAALLAAVPTLMDWQTNPDSLFHNTAGTDWAIVWETWFSWFWPIAFLALGAALFVKALRYNWLRTRRSKDSS